MALLTIYKRISALFPRSIVKATSKMLLQGGFDELDARTFLGFALFVSISATLTAFFLAPLFFEEKLLHLAAAVFALAVSLALFYLFLSMRVDSRSRKIEEVLPVALQMISANIRAGMTLENAVWSSARPEFGPFKDEIQRMSAKSFGGAPLTETLKEMSKRVNSQIVERSIRLINEGIILGGEMAHLLDQVAFDIRSTQLLQKEIAVATTTYAIFIIFAAVVASPLLFSVSTYYATLNEKLVEKQSGTGYEVNQSIPAQAGPFSAFVSGGGKKEGGINSGDIRLFSIVAIAVSSFFAALILGLIREGKGMRGLKYAPVFVLIALGLYFLFSIGLESAFSSFVK
ncbi:MAG TPA: type II secretion system F family protein [Candidatus Norongarragalinales archaeon]|nr:type II secretion system F family protein [Candidatus Norongarragalinales archaeon]